MCGLISIHTNQGDLSQKEFILDNMIAKITHRGPDGEGKVHIPNQALFGHRRLAIIDVEHGQQPMRCNNNRYTLVFNGEIYNYIELAEILKKDGISLNSSSDT